METFKITLYFLSMIGFASIGAVGCSHEERGEAPATIPNVAQREVGKVFCGKVTVLTVDGEDYILVQVEMTGFPPTYTICPKVKSAPKLPEKYD